MIIQKIPFFHRGTVLTQDMMEAMKEYAITMGQLTYLGYSDGIWKGCRLTVNEDMIVVNPGILIYSNVPILIQKPEIIRYSHCNSLRILAARVGEEEISQDYSTRIVQFKLISEEELNHKDIEFARFTLQEGAELRSHYRDFYDIPTAFNTLSIAYSKWAAYEQETMSYEILRSFADEAIKAGCLDEHDHNFIQLIYSQSGESLQRRIIENYIQWKLKRSVAERSIFELYKGLCECLKLIQGGKLRNDYNEPMKRRLIVD